MDYGLCTQGCEAWHLLTGDEPGAWQRYQRFTIHAAADPDAE